MSYGLYLWHFVVFSTIDAALGLESWGPRILGLVVTAVIVPLSYRYVELPFLGRSAAGEPNTGIAETSGSDDAQVQGRPL
jgi:peptidoglycan/LPS O-acetylase OafA/YrhL